MYTSGEAHGTGTSSLIKTNVDKFYADKLASYSSKIDTEVGFCGDRSTLNLQSGVGTGTITTYNKAHFRVEKNLPTLTCEDIKDYYTVSSASIGNQALIYPIGLITADEAIYAGHAGDVSDNHYNHSQFNKKSYLITGSWFWTMTPVGGYNPFGITYWHTYVFGIGGSGVNAADHVTNSASGLRPVINIRSDATMTGSGTMTDPYVVS